MVLRGETLWLVQALLWRRVLVCFQSTMDHWPGHFFFVLTQTPLSMALPAAWSWWYRIVFKRHSPLPFPSPQWLVGCLQTVSHSVTQAGPLSEPSASALYVLGLQMCSYFFFFTAFLHWLQVLTHTHLTSFTLTVFYFLHSSSLSSKIRAETLWNRHTQTHTQPIG